MEDHVFIITHSQIHGQHTSQQGGLLGSGSKWVVT